MKIAGCSARSSGISSRARLALAAAATLFLAPVFAAPGGGVNGTTFAASKTVDVCEDSVATVKTWRYSGVVSVWNQGVLDTVGFAMTDCIQNKAGSGQFKDAYCTSSFTPGLQEIPAGTTLETATTFAYTMVGAPLAGDIRNVARPTILNHSNHIGSAYGPEPKATWTGGTPPPCLRQDEGGCTYTQGYWGNKPSVVWPSPYARTNPFYLATDATGNALSWQGALDLPPKGSGYYILAEQYIAAVLNAANGATVPAGVQSIIAQATAFFATSYPSTCTAAGSCGTQKTWAGILDVYNNGKYPDGPKHCGDE